MHMCIILKVSIDTWIRFTSLCQSANQEYTTPQEPLLAKFNTHKKRIKFLNRYYKMQVELKHIRIAPTQIQH